MVKEGKEIKEKMTDVKLEKQTDEKEKKEESKSGGKRSNWKKKAGFTVIGLIVFYIAVSVFFQYHYFLGTKINGYSCGLQSVAKVKETIKQSVTDYKITLRERSDRKETISSKQIGLQFVDDGKLENVEKDQKGYAWITALFRPYIYENEITLTVDEGAYESTYQNLNAFNTHLVVAPVNAFSRYDKEKGSYVIAEEVYGNTIKSKKFYEVLKTAIINQKKQLDLEEAGCYKNPVYTKDAEEVVAANDTLNKYVSTDITYDFEDRTQELTGKKIHKWIYATKKYEVKLREEKVAEYIAELAAKYDTVGVDREFTSIAGNHVSVSGGTYGWKIDQEAETAKLVKLIKKGKQGKRTPEYAHIAKSRKKFDIGDTYIEVSLGDQYMWFYKNGKTVVSTPVVTGDPSKGRATPTGVYYILYKTTNYTLTGQGYASDVEYWLPFMQKGVGIHDSSWRSGYGGGIYYGDGSHGCVNTPRSAVEKIYNNIESTYPVVVHY